MWNFYGPTEIIFGEGRIKEIGDILGKKGYEKALLVCDPTSLKLGTAKRLQKFADGRIFKVFSGVEPNPTVQNVDACVEEVKDDAIDCIIALGGGSSIDCAKAAAAAIKMGVSASDLLDLGILERALPVIAIPTTAGTGSEVTAGAVISDHEHARKQAVFGPAIFAKVAIIDPELTYTCPDFVTASSGIDVLAHALDSLTSKKTTPATIGLAVYAARLAFENLEKVCADGSDREARRHMAEASLIAGMAFSQTGTTGSHACSYILTAKYRIPHGEACAFTLDWWFRENIKACPQLDIYAEMMGFPNAEAVADRIEEIKKQLHLRRFLHEFVTLEEDVDEIIDSSMNSANMANNIWQAERQDLVRLFATKG